MHHAPLTAQQRTQYLAARLHHPSTPAHTVLAKLRHFRLWYSAGALLYPHRIPSVRQCIVAKAHGMYCATTWTPQPPTPRAQWRFVYAQARRAMR